MDEKEFEERDEELKGLKKSEEAPDGTAAATTEDDETPSLDDLADADMGPDEELYDDVDNL